MLQVRLFRPFAVENFLAALPASCRAVAVLEQAKEPGSPGEPLYLDVVTTLAQAVAAGGRPTMPRVIGGRYGLGSKNFNPAQAKAVFDELKKPDPKNGFTVGIDDDVSHTSLAVDAGFSIERDDVVSAVFYGLGADGTVGANKNSVKIIAEDPELFAQGYFVYDSHKSGAQTISHLRFGKRPIHSPYLIESANFVACHQAAFLDRIDVLRLAATGGTFLLNTPHGPDEVWDRLPRSVQRQILEKKLRFFVIDASKVARDTGLGGRVNTVLQTCFFAISGVLPREEAIARIKHAIEKSYGSKGADVVRRNFEAVDQTLAHLFEVIGAGGGDERLRPCCRSCRQMRPAFVREVTAKMMLGLGDDIRVSQMPIDGTYPSGTAAFEKRNISEERGGLGGRPLHSVRPMQLRLPARRDPRQILQRATALDDAPAGFRSAPVNSRGNPDVRFSLQFYLEDCTGCGICVEVCPAHSPRDPGVKAVNLAPKTPILEQERANIAFFETLPTNDRARVDFANVRGVQFLEPLFEFSGACAGCGETPYLKLLSQLFGDRLQVANATGCSSIYGASLPVTPWTQERRGTRAGLVELAVRGQRRIRPRLPPCRRQASRASGDAARHAGTHRRRGPGPSRSSRRRRSRNPKSAPSGPASPSSRRSSPPSTARHARDLLSVVDHFVRRSIWIVGGDGWAYDIGYGGLDHVLACDRDVNVLVLDTEVYSNTGGQASKATPLGAVAKFAAGGKRVARKDLALQAIAYGNVYVAQVAMGAYPQQTLLAFREAEAYPGPALIIAYSHCIAHGFDLRFGMKQQDLATASGYWPLFRYNPAMRAIGENPFRLDSPRPTIPVQGLRL